MHDVEVVPSKTQTCVPLGPVKPTHAKAGLLGFSKLDVKAELIVSS